MDRAEPFTEFESEVPEDASLGLTELGEELADLFSAAPPCAVEWDEASGVHRCTECGQPFLSLAEVHQILDETTNVAHAVLDEEFSAGSSEVEDEVGSITVIDLFG